MYIVFILIWNQLQKKGSIIGWKSDISFVTAPVAYASKNRVGKFTPCFFFPFFVYVRTLALSSQHTVWGTAKAALAIDHREVFSFHVPNILFLIDILQFFQKKKWQQPTKSSRLMPETWIAEKSNPPQLKPCITESGEYWIFRWYCPLCWFCLSFDSFFTGLLLKSI